MQTRLATLTLALLLASCGGDHDELGHKDDYSFLQAVEYRTRGQLLERRIITFQDPEHDRCAAGIQTDGFARVWILVTHDTDVLRVPNEDFKLSPEGLRQIVEECEPSEAVLEYLTRTSDAV